MHNPLDDEIERQLIGIISEGFNRALGALEDAGVIDTRKLKKHYSGIGSKYYDIVTEQIVLTAKYRTPGVRQLFAKKCEKADGN